jgi:16S rRNA processing protein RimM
MQPGEGHGHGTVLVARLEQIDDRTQAEQLTGARVAVARKELPAPAPGEFYWSDLVGLSVINEQGITLGAVQEVLDTGAHAVLRVVGECERLIPFVDAYVRDVDAAGRAIRVDWQPDY